MAEAVSAGKKLFEMTVSVTLIEIYNECFYDLLAGPDAGGEEASKLQVRNLGPEHGGLVIQGAASVQARSLALLCDVWFNVVVPFSFKVA